MAAQALMALSFGSAYDCFQSNQGFVKLLTAGVFISYWTDIHINNTYKSLSYYTMHLGNKTLDLS